ncbi:outer membrane protein romA [Aquitalea magnusonii]|uniref:Outer membrane protein romA n=2 Tax=Aquitalea magnusonii TaxID=332411 RepID=A0A3G9GDB4_9NEIS|nr:outer membrane protein romA [Aquitalea magnusonii]
MRPLAKWPGRLHLPLTPLADYFMLKRPDWMAAMFNRLPYQARPGKTHHGPAGYRNLYPFALPSLASLLYWKLSSLWRQPPDHRPEMIPVCAGDAAALRTNRRRPSITWLGHASSFIQLEGMNVLIDPVLSPRVSPFGFVGPKRQVAMPLDLPALPRIDLVLLTHLHYDHLDFATLRRLAGQQGGAPHIVLPLGVSRAARAAGIPAERIVELDWWQACRHGPLRILLTPAHHWSNRGPWGDLNRALWGGFLLEGGGKKIWFPGDTGYRAELFHEIGLHIGPVDFALLPIGAYEPRKIMRAQHVNPEEAVRIFRHVAARKAWAVHWGTFILTDEPIQQPMAELAMALREQHVSAADFMLPAIGETIWL